MTKHKIYNKRSGFAHAPHHQLLSPADHMLKLPMKDIDPCQMVGPENYQFNRASSPLPGHPTTIAQPNSTVSEVTTVGANTSIFAQWDYMKRQDMSRRMYERLFCIAFLRLLQQWFETLWIRVWAWWDMKPLRPYCRFKSITENTFKTRKGTSASNTKVSKCPSSSYVPLLPWKTVASAG